MKSLKSDINYATQEEEKKEKKRQRGEMPFAGKKQKRNLVFSSFPSVRCKVRRMRITCDTESVSVHSILDVQYLISPDQQDEAQ